MPDYAPESVEFVGPVEQWWVSLNGYRVPFLTALPRNGGVIDLTLDDRYLVTLTVEEADRFIPFIADAIAVARGFACHPRGLDHQPEPWSPAKRLVSLVVADDG
jgi:hypothetical protein